MCRCRTERKRRRLVIEKTEDQMGKVFSAYGTPLTAAYLFCYLGQTVLSNDEDWLAVE